MARSDAELIAEVAEGDVSVFREIVERYQNQVMSTVYRFTGDYYQAEDLTQEVFIRVFKSAKRYEPRAKFRTWLFRIVVNLCLNYRRDRARKRTQPLDAPVNGTDGEVVRDVRGPDSDIPEVVLEKMELKRMVREAIDDLPEKQRLVIILQRFEEMPYKEISEALDISLSAVESLLFRARQNLKKRLAPYLFLK
jgi:RNA polymerase sigma-70 factor (ECF subfamily)